MLKHLTNKEEFLEMIKQEKVLVDFYAEWCGPCQMLTPNLEILSKDMQVLKVDVDQFSDIAIDYGVMSVPTLILFENGKEVSKKIGYLELEQLEELCKVSK